MNCSVNIPLCFYKLYLNPVYHFIYMCIYISHYLCVRYFKASFFCFVFDIILLFSLTFFSLNCTYPLHSSCSHRHPVSLKQSQKRLHCAVCLHPLLQHLQKWAVTKPHHLQAKSQKWTKRMSLAIAGVSCCFVMHLIVKGIKRALWFSRLMP